MLVFIPVIISLLIPSAVEMSQAKTGEFRQGFPEWGNASQVRVSCKKENDTNETQIAQYCDDDQIQSCRKMNKTGVSLEKDQDGLLLTITNNSYDSWSCEAQSYTDDDEKKKNFTVNFANQPTNTSPSPGATDASPSQDTYDNSLSQDLTNTSPSAGSIELLLLFLGVVFFKPGVVFAVLLFFTLILFIIMLIYKKVKSNRKTKKGHLNSPNPQQLEMEERGENRVTGENEAMQDDGVMLENEVLGENKVLRETLENGELGENEALRENGETLALEQNGRQERRQAKIKKKVTHRATSNVL